MQIFKLIKLIQRLSYRKELTQINQDKNLVISTTHQFSRNYYNLDLILYNH